jgi:hypothetical protein
MTSMFVNIIDTCRICLASVTPKEPQKLFWQAETQQFQRAHANCIKKICTRAKNFTKLSKPVERDGNVLVFPI